MWHEARANEKRIKELMVDHKKRAERRRAFYESRLGDPKQLLRVIGSSTKLYPDAEQFYYHENQDNLMPWQGNTDIRIDRFDGRSLLDYVPEKKTKQIMPVKEQHMMDELNFERYHDLVEAERLKVSERERLNEVEEEWTKLLERHKALLAMLNNSKKPEKGYGYDYGTSNVSNDDALEQEDESQLLKEADILQYVDDLTDKDKKTLNDMASKYGIRNYSRLLRMVKRDRDEQLRELKAKQGKDNGGKSKDASSGSSSRRSRDERSSRRRRRRSRYDRKSPSRGGRSSPTYEPYYNDSESDSSVEEDENSNSQSDVVIEFGSSSSNLPEQHDEDPRTSSTLASSSRDRHASQERGRKSSIENNQPSSSSALSKDTKKLTPMERLRLKMREGLEKQNEREKKHQEREYELNVLRGSYKGDRDVSEKKSSSDKKSTTRRYYSPSGSDNDRSPSPSSHGKRRRYRSPSTSGSDNNSDSSSNRRRRRRSPSIKRSKHRSRSRSPSSRRHSSSSHHHKSSSSSSRRSHYDHHHHHSKSSKRRSRSRSRSRSSRHKRR
ncbi:alternative splicing regulator-domain-containing protein [Circinella umbellata]|nr:alternative splicing regulator-domain-containing protein [Circinella umbellata]